MSFVLTLRKNIPPSSLRASVLQCRVFFFFQAEDGIRDHCVTGVQTCALPIFIDTNGNVVATPAGDVNVTVPPGVATTLPFVSMISSLMPGVVGGSWMIALSGLSTVFVTCLAAVEPVAGTEVRRD